MLTSFYIDSPREFPVNVPAPYDKLRSARFQYYLTEKDIARFTDNPALLRRYRHRWIIERTFAWLGSFRRLLVRHERLTSMYCSLLYFASALIALRRF